MTVTLGPIVTPTDDQRARAHDHVREVWPHIEPHHTRYSGRDPRELVESAFLAEVIVADFTGGEWHRVVGSDDGGFDVTVGDGRTAQVKWNNWPAGDLYTEHHKPITADVAVLVVPVEWDSDVRLAGYCTRESFAELARPATWSPKTALAVSQAALLPVRYLVGP